MSESSVVFLLYHELEEAGHPLCQTEPGYVRYVLPVAEFRAQMELLKHEGWRGVSVGEALAFSGPERVAITFDDGSGSDLLRAAPILREHGFGATFYITQGFLEKPGYLTSPQLMELSALGFEIGCHSKTHPYLTDLDDAGLQREIAEPKAELEQIIGRAIEHFSCPGGRYDGRVADVARRAGYRTVATSRIQSNRRSSDPYALGRVAVLRGTGLDAFRRTCRGEGLWRMNAALHLRETSRRLLGNALYDRFRALLLRASAGTR